MSSKSPDGSTPAPDPGVSAPGAPSAPAPPDPESAPAPPSGALDAWFASAQAAPDPESDGWTVSRLAIVGAVGMLLIAIGALAAAGALALLRGPGSGPVSAADRALLANSGAGIVPDVAASHTTPQPTGTGAGPAPGRASRALPPPAPDPSSPAVPSPTPSTPVDRTCTVVQQPAADLGGDLIRNRGRWIRVTVMSAAALRVAEWRLVFQLPSGEQVLRVLHGEFQQEGRQVAVLIGREPVRASAVRSFAYRVSGRVGGAEFALNGAPCGLASAPAG